MQELFRNRRTCGGSPPVLLAPLSDGQQLGCAGPGSETLVAIPSWTPWSSPEQAEVELDF